MNKFTKWKANNGTHENPLWHVTDEVGRVLAESLTKEQATLIAAAPELLSNLKDLVRCVRDGQLGDFSPLMDEVFDSEHAIKKAKGDF